MTRRGTSAVAAVIGGWNDPADFAAADAANDEEIRAGQVAAAVYRSTLDQVGITLATLIAADIPAERVLSDVARTIGLTPCPDRRGES